MSVVYGGTHSVMVLGRLKQVDRCETEKSLSQKSKQMSRYLDMIAPSVQEDLESECFITVIQVLLILQVVEQTDRIEVCPPSEDHLSSSLECLARSPLD